MRYQILKIAITTVLYCVLVSCSDNDVPQLINEEELITTVEYTLTNDTDATNVVVYKSVDADGSGPEAPTLMTTGTLLANSTYSGTIRFLNESVAPAENITEEVQEESSEHEVFYATSIAGIAITKTDTDSDGNLLGLRTALKTEAPGNGNLTIVLRHEPIKPNDNTLSGAAGETDAQVVYSLIIQ
ncbi:type 1 periplasmic binding fold superfamily protein [Nonlabens antarcticus]|uniref:type 1 periplasmic binding fold superfamily protein n=1 Tax=Nonlabens antarcticus TaxID=392714 RepID=UPI0018914CDF|nr:type 1 periplasmic binding fold superfamily protein [Nonlabens antarcticus]